MNRKKAEELLKIEGNDAIIVDTNEEGNETVGEALREICQEQGLLLQTNTMFSNSCARRSMRW